MKALISILLCCLLCAALVGCTQSSSDEALSAVPVVTEPEEPTLSDTLPDNYTFPAGTVLHGIKIGCMPVDTAYETLCEKVDAYDLFATVNGKTLTYYGSTLGISCSEEDFLDYAYALYAGQEIEKPGVISYDKAHLSRRVAGAMNTYAKNADIIYNEETGLFELIPGTNGKHVDLDTLMSVLYDAVDSLQSNVTVRVTEFADAPAVSESDPVTLAALDKANDYLTTELSYNFTVDDDVENVLLSKDRLLKMIGFDGKLNPYIIPSELKAYVDEVNKDYGLTALEGNFVTTQGNKTDHIVKYYAQYLDVDAFYDDILYYLEKGISGTRLPPHLDVLNAQEMAYKGSYIEVDLTNQTLYLYKDTECILETPIVTGCVSRYMRTPTGVYKVLVRRMHVVLKGEDYETYVKYWMQFYGGYGLHDAYWRWQFGGNEYLYNGSHGCVNIPPDNAAFVFENITTGYPVIVHGGASNDGPLQQTILGTDSYDATIYTKPFQLDTKTAVGNGKLTYTASNPAVASVDEDGIVTIHKTGNAYIDVEFPESRYYTGATLRVNINVTDPCGSEHTFGGWKVTTPATCVDGEQTRTCKDCGKEEKRSILPDSNHCYGAWEETIEPDCVIGEERRVCIVCGEEIYREIPAEHTLRDWRTRKEATCTEPGERYRSCRWCDYEETEVLPALGHSFIDEEETCTECDTPNPNWIPPTKPEEEDE